MDDDLNALRGGPPQNEDDFFSSLGASAPSGGSSAPASGSGSLDLGLDAFGPPSDAAAAAPAPARKAAPKKKPARKSSGGGTFLGMTPQQRMVLSLFLFLDVAVLGLLILFALGVINIPVG